MLSTSKEGDAYIFDDTRLYEPVWRRICEVWKLPAIMYNIICCNLKVLFLFHYLSNNDSLILKLINTYHIVMYCNNNVTSVDCVVLAAGFGFDNEVSKKMIDDSIFFYISFSRYMHVMTFYDVSLHDSLMPSRPIFAYFSHLSPF